METMRAKKSEQKTVFNFTSSTNFTTQIEKDMK